MDIHGEAPTWRNRIRPGLRVIDESEDDDYAVQSDSSDDNENTLEEKGNTHATGTESKTSVQNRFKN